MNARTTANSCSQVSYRTKMSVGLNDMLTQIVEHDATFEKYSAMLEREVQVRTYELEEAYNRRVSRLENLARVLQHELKNTIVGVKSSLNLIERRACSEESLGPYIARARASMSNMGKLLDSVGNASTLEAAVYKEPRNHLDLSQLVTKILKEYGEMYQWNDIDAACDQGLHIIGSELLITQMLINLLSNAVEHCRTGTAILVSLKKESGEALLSITDEGDPLPENIERIFDLFVSIQPPHRKQKGNMGIGLNLVKLVAESHGGGVSVRRLPRMSGAVFTVNFPLAA